MDHVPVFRLVSHMPTGSELGIITVGASSATVNIEPTVVRESNREGLHGRIPYRLLNDREACLSCGIEKAKELLNPEHQGSIMIVSAELNHSDLFSDEVVPIHQVFFDETLKVYPNVTHRSRQYKNGAVFKVPRTPRILQSLSSIFLSLLKLAHGPHIECTYQRFYHFETNTMTEDNNYEVVCFRFS